MNKYIFDSLEDIFLFGKYNEIMIGDVLAIDMSYVYWCQGNIPEFYITDALLNQIVELFPEFLLSD